LQHISARGQENLIALTVSKQAGPQQANSKMHEAAQQIDKHNQKYENEYQPLENHAQFDMRLE